MIGKLYSPTGKLIIGTCDTMLVTSNITSIERSEDGTLDIGFDGYKDHGDSIQQETDDAGQLLYATRDGDEWPENLLVFVPEGQPLPEFDRNYVMPRQGGPATVDSYEI